MLASSWKLQPSPKVLTDYGRHIQNFDIQISQFRINTRAPHSPRDRSPSDGNDMLKAVTAAGRMLELETQLVTSLEAMR